jgi:hypothetical protein
VVYQPAYCPGAILDDKAGGLVGAEPGAGRVRVGHVGLRAVGGVEDGGDASLGPGAGTVLKGSLGDEGYLELVGKAQCEGLSGKAAAQDEDIEKRSLLELPQRAILRSADYSMGTRPH